MTAATEMSSLAQAGHLSNTTRTHCLPSSSHLSYVAGTWQAPDKTGTKGVTAIPSTYSLSRECLCALPTCLPAFFYLHSGLLQLASGLCPLEQGAIVQLPPEASGPLSAERFSLRPGPLALCHLWAEDREPRSLAGKGGVHLQKPTVGCSSRKH